MRVIEVFAKMTNFLLRREPIFDDEKDIFYLLYTFA
jgi:hypothetical protein